MKFLHKLTWKVVDTVDIAEAIFVMSLMLTATKATWPHSINTQIASMIQFVILVATVRFSGQKFVDSRRSFGMKSDFLTGSLKGKMSPRLVMLMGVAIKSRLI